MRARLPPPPPVAAVAAIHPVSPAPRAYARLPLLALLALALPGLAACLPLGEHAAATQTAPRPASTVPSDPFASDEAQARTPVDPASASSAQASPVLLQ
ncbi:MAG: hypothetical protein ACRELB_24080, partial [Polyangiaceae bacterium]